MLTLTPLDTMEITMAGDAHNQLPMVTITSTNHVQSTITQAKRLTFLVTI